MNTLHIITENNEVLRKVIALVQSNINLQSHLLGITSTLTESKHVEYSQVIPGSSQLVDTGHTPAANENDIPEKTRDAQGTHRIPSNVGDSKATSTHHIPANTGDSQGVPTHQIPEKVGDSQCAPTNQLPEVCHANIRTISSAENVGGDSQGTPANHAPSAIEVIGDTKSGILPGNENTDHVLTNTAIASNGIITHIPRSLKGLLTIMKPLSVCKEDDYIRDLEVCQTLRILVISTQYPGGGGSATNAYNIIKYLRKNNCNVCGLFCEPVDKFSHTLYDPENIGGIFRCPRWNYYVNKYDTNYIRGDLQRYRHVINKFLKGDPTIILCKNYIAPICSAIMYPDVPRLYLISGSKHLTSSNMTYEQLMNTDPCKLEMEHKCEDEVEAITKSLTIIPNSWLTYCVFAYIYPQFVSKICKPINTSFLSYFESNNNVAFDERKYDVGLVCSNFNRGIKNAKLGHKILQSPLLRTYSKVAIGENSSMCSSIPDIHIVDILPNAKVIEYLSNTKIIIMPSLYDSSPNLATEAMCCGCKLVFTLNVGNSERYNQYYCVDSVTDEGPWVSKIIEILAMRSDKLPNTITNTESATEHEFLTTLIEYSQ